MIKGSGVVNDRVPAYLHNRPALDHFWAIRPDLHLTISIFAWYLPLKDWNLYYVFAHLFVIWQFLSLFDPTRIWPFFSYSTRLALDYFTICMVFAIEKLKFILHIRRSTRNLTIFESIRPNPHLTKWYLHWTVLDYLGIR